MISASRFGDGLAEPPVPAQYPGGGAGQDEQYQDDRVGLADQHGQYPDAGSDGRPGGAAQDLFGAELVDGERGVQCGQSAGDGAAAAEDFVDEPDRVPDQRCGDPAQRGAGAAAPGVGE